MNDVLQVIVEKYVGNTEKYKFKELGWYEKNQLDFFV